MFSENFRNFLKTSQTIVSRSNARKLKAGFLNVFEKSPKIMHFCKFLKKFFKISLASEGLGHPDPYKADPLKCFPEPKSWRRRCINVHFNHQLPMQILYMGSFSHDRLLGQSYVWFNLGISYMV